MNVTIDHQLTITEVGDTGLLLSVCSCGDSVTGPWFMTADWGDLHLGRVTDDHLVALVTA